MNDATGRPDVLQEFGTALLEFLESWRGRPGLSLDFRADRSRIEEEPGLDPATGIRWMRSRRGPQIRLHLVATDAAATPSEIEAAYWRDPSEWATARVDTVSGPRGTMILLS